MATVLKLDEDKMVFLIQTHTSLEALGDVGCESVLPLKRVSVCEFLGLWLCSGSGFVGYYWSSWFSSCCTFSLFLLHF